MGCDIMTESCLKYELSNINIKWCMLCACARICVCLCVREREREREKESDETSH
jgi:hypothetical protein